MNYIGYIRKLLNQPIGAIPVGLKVNIAGVKLGFERQFEIDGKVRLDVVSDKKKVVSIDGVAKNKPMQVKKLNEFIFKNSDFGDIRKGLSIDAPIFKKQYGNKIKKLVKNLSQEVRDYNNPKKTTTKKTTTRKTTKRKVNPDKAGFLIRNTVDGFISEPKSKFTIYTNEKLPGVKFFVGKIKDYWFVFELMSGKSIGDGQFKKLAIEEADRIIENNSVEKIKSVLKKHRLPKAQLDIVMKPYKAKTTTRTTKVTSKKATPKKSTPKKVTPKKVKSKKRVITKKGKAGNLVYVGREKVGNKMLYQYEYKNIPKRK